VEVRTWTETEVTETERKEEGRMGMIGRRKNEKYEGKVVPVLFP
jgi:hypothetical protein